MRRGRGEGCGLSDWSAPLRVLGCGKCSILSGVVKVFVGGWDLWILIGTVLFAVSQLLSEYGLTFLRERIRGSAVPDHSGFFFPCPRFGWSSRMRELRLRAGELAERDVVDAGGCAVELLGRPFLVAIVPVVEGSPELIGNRLGILLFQGFTDELAYLVYAIVS